MAIEYKRVNELLDQMGVCDADKPSFAMCCENNSETFKLIRAQLLGDLNYTIQQGAYIDNEEHKAFSRYLYMVKALKEGKFSKHLKKNLKRRIFYIGIKR